MEEPAPGRDADRPTAGGEPHPAPRIGFLLAAITATPARSAHQEA